MRDLLVRVLVSAAAWLDAQNERLLEKRALKRTRTFHWGMYLVDTDGYRYEPKLCPDCVFVKDDYGVIVEVIDCQTNNHHILSQPS